MNARQTVTRKIVIIREFLSLPQHRNPLARIQRNRVRLQLVEQIAIPLRQRITVIALRPGEHNQLAVIMTLQILERNDRPLRRVPRRIDDRL